MPNMDGTGPRGLGQQTGKGRGSCGCGQRMGFGRGYGTSRMMTLSDAEQKKILEGELAEIEREKQAIENRLKEMK